jgi:hypothetical protein
VVRVKKILQIIFAEEWKRMLSLFLIRFLSIVKIDFLEKQGKEFLYQGG